jgi:hypothetical protein
MLLSNLAPIAATISGFTATASLIYVAIQTRLSVRHTRALIHQGAAARTTNALLRMMDPDVVAAWIEGNGGAPTPELIRRRQFHYYCGTTMIAIEDYFSQHEHGLFSEEQFARGSATFRERLKEPGLRAYWLENRETMAKAAPRYCAFIDSLCDGETATVGDWAPRRPLSTPA